MQISQSSRTCLVRRFYSDTCEQVKQVVRARCPPASNDQCQKTCESHTHCIILHHRHYHLMPAALPTPVPQHIRSHLGHCDTGQNQHHAKLHLCAANVPTSHCALVGKQQSSVVHITCVHICTFCAKYTARGNLFEFSEK